MNNQTLQTLCQQLAAWAQTAIDEGNYPFRKVELFPPLLTDTGEISPPLVLWINRDSFMAGAIIFFPDNIADEHFAPGLSCATALGLDHFVTWDRKDIICWKVSQEKSTASWTLPARPLASDSAISYRNLLVQLLGELKFMAVKGLLPAKLLSPYYFANLFRTTLNYALPGLRDQHRRERVGPLQHPTALSPETAALGKAVTSLLRLVALVGFDALPASVQPEGLEQASRYALETLPRELLPTLAFSGNELPLTYEAAIRFHHLLRRLTQLHLDTDLARAAKALEILLGSFSHQLSGAPRPVECSLPGPGGLLVNPASPYSPEPPFFESAPLPILALCSLVRTFCNLPAATQQFSAPLLIGADVRPSSICGVLVDDRVPLQREHSLLSTYLRTSWPGRRWTFPSGTPRWAWELLHLLGLAESDATIDLTTPGGWLASPFAAVLFEVMTEHFSLLRVHLSTTAELRFHLTKSVNPPAEVLLLTPYGERALPARRLRQAPGPTLALALTLPPAAFLLVADGSLQPIAPEFSPEQLAGANLFSASTLGRLLTTCLCEQGALSLPGQLFDPKSYPLPDLQLLEQLASALSRESSQEEIDQEMQCFFPHCQLSPVSAFSAEHSMAQAKLTKESSSTPRLEELLIRTVFSDGIPLFPDHYLFGYVNPETFLIELPQPLAVTETFFDHATLTDASGRRLEIAGLATARAIVLCSYGRHLQVRLPVDQTIMRAILERYLTDLRRLHRTLRQLAHQHLGSARQAENLAARVWTHMHLPPPGLIDG